VAIPTKVAQLQPDKGDRHLNEAGVVAMNAPDTIDLFRLRDSLIQGALREEFERSVREKIADPDRELLEADRTEVEQLMHRTWYESVLLLAPADTAPRIEAVLRNRYISLRARWQRYWVVHQTGLRRAAESAKTIHMLYDLVSDLKSTYLVTISKALGGDEAMQLWRRCERVSREVAQEWRQADRHGAELIDDATQHATDALDRAGERCTAWPPLTLELHDQLCAVVNTLRKVDELFETHSDACAECMGLFAVDNEALLTGLEQAMGWERIDQPAPGRHLIDGYRGVLSVVAPRLAEQSGDLHAVLRAA
jgi:hypothetical protein